MTPDDAAHTYRESTFENAPPLKLVRMLYAGALRFLRQAVEVGPDAHNEFNGHLQRADAIVAELHCSLDREQGGEVAEQLEALYGFVSEQLASAMLERSVEPIEPARHVLATLLDAWNQVQAAEVPAA